MSMGDQAGRRQGDVAPGARLLAAPDKFRGTASAAEIASAFARGAGTRGWQTVELPLADGGEGTLAALGGPTEVTRVVDALGRPRDAAWRLDGDAAVIELALASGLESLGGAESNDPLRASTAGTAELINTALRAGARHIVVAVGGSASTDGGLAAVNIIERERLADVELFVACDVATRFLDAARVFGPQKGATPDQVLHLEARLHRAAAWYRRELGVDVAGVAGAGAAGGFAGGLLALGARLVDGFGLVAEHVGLRSQLARADAVLTGEGCLDRTSFSGKVVGGILSLAQEHNVPAGVIAGRVNHPAPHARCLALVDRFGEADAMNRTVWCAEQAASSLLSDGVIA